MPKNTSATTKTPRSPRASKAEPFVYASAGPYTQVDKTGNIVADPLSDKLVAVRRQAKLGDPMAKVAGLFDSGELGPANIADSSNIGMYSYEFPVDAMELPASRMEELRFYRLAVDRDPIVGHGIDLHATIPVSKMSLEKPKSSVQEFADYVYDFYERLVGDTQLWPSIVEAVREYFQIGEAFIFVEEPDLDIQYSDIAKEALQKGRGFMAGMNPISEAENAPLASTEGNITKDFVSAKRSSANPDEAPKVADRVTLSSKRSFLQKQAKKRGVSSKFLNAGITLSPKDKVEEVEELIEQESIKLAQLIREAKLGVKTASIKKTAEPGDVPDAGGGDAPIDATPGDTPPDTLSDEGDTGLEGGDDFGGGGGDLGGGGFGGGSGSFGGGGGGGLDSMGEEGESIGDAISSGEDAKHRRRVSELKRYLHLLEIKKDLLEELNDVVEKKNLQKEVFSHVTNEKYEGFTRIQMLPPEQIEIENGGGGNVVVFYKPSAEESASYLEDANVDPGVKDALDTNGQIELNQNPYEASYVIHFARKKAGYELHGRSILQRCIRTIIYREKLRQVQTTLASRNMTPKTLLVAPGVSAAQVAELRAHADEAKADPDYTIVTNYAVTWEEIGSGGRLLQLADEWQHTNSDLAIGLGFSPEILIGEGMYSNSRIQLELMSTVYLQLRQSISDIVENKIFKPIAIKKGFYEIDNYGRPRWIFPKISFGRMALRDSGDLYDSLLNLYSKGSLPVSVLYETLELDPEAMERELVDDLYTVRDSQFNQVLSNVYGAIAQNVVDKTDLLNILSQGMRLKETDISEEGLEGSGEGFS